MIGLTVLAAATYFMSGNDLYESICGPTGERIACAEYAAGALDAFGVADDVAGRERPYCLPVGARVGQVGDVLKLYLATHPEKRTSTGALIALMAVHEAFPCRR